MDKRAAIQLMQTLDLVRSVPQQAFVSLGTAQCADLARLYRAGLVDRKEQFAVCLYTINDRGLALLEAME